MRDEQSKEHAPEITAEELEEQAGELLPDREAMSVIEDLLRGPMARERGVPEDVLDKALDYRAMAKPHDPASS